MRYSNITFYLYYNKIAIEGSSGLSLSIAIGIFVVGSMTQKKIFQFNISIYKSNYTNNYHISLPNS